MTDPLLRGQIPERLARYAARSGRTLAGAGRFLIEVALRSEPPPSALTYPLGRLPGWPEGLLAPYAALQFYAPHAPVRSTRFASTEAALVDYGMRLCVNSKGLDPELLSAAERARRVEKVKGEAT